MCAKHSKVNQGRKSVEYIKKTKIVVHKTVLASLDHLEFCRKKREAKTKLLKSAYESFEKREDKIKRLKSAYESLIRQIKIAQGRISVLKSKSPPNPERKPIPRNLQHGGYSCGKCGKKTLVKGHVCEYLPIPESLLKEVIVSVSNEMKAVLRALCEKKKEDYEARLGMKVEDYKRWLQEKVKENAFLGLEVGDDEWLNTAAEIFEWFRGKSFGEGSGGGGQEEDVGDELSSIGLIEKV